MRITLVISTFGAGGAERVMAVMANHWAEHGYDITLVTLARSDEDFYPLHPAVQRVGLGVMKVSSGLREALWNNLVRLKQLRDAIRLSRPDVVISFIERTNILVLLSTIGLPVPIVACERIDPRHHSIGPVWSGLRRCLYRRAASLVVQTEGLRSWAEGFVPARSVHVIPNPIAIVSEEASAERTTGGRSKCVSALGRLVPQKGFDTLLQAFAHCIRTHADWSLTIVGEGPERSQLEALSARLGIEDRVSLIGRRSNPFPILRQTDLFVLSSRYEGFPMALVEAMACRLPVISTDCPSGPRDIIRDGVDGILVPPNDVSALTQAMTRLMENSDERHRLRMRAGEVVDRFSTARIMALWEELVTDVVGPSSSWSVTPGRAV
ncbi:MAG TPA: glycosyltransferase family 4 protein [Nitrospira sp.]|jgi:GalNAc-alpha-(1->4)-GalNAc-alpha-(1->3)-diNAcBac-PP-undecaprenol alpha-1,4-N-acetyl-D-galactosaminyltransferase|nr:glycosyltransferase family 4 protein [Nitrospira sp.]HNP84184.1 glycosyltransferase family 4 protein [Nitrospira sp.]